MCQSVEPCVAEVHQEHFAQNEMFQIVIRGVLCCQHMIRETVSVSFKNGIASSNDDGTRCVTSRPHRSSWCKQGKLMYPYGALEGH